MPLPPALRDIYGDLSLAPRCVYANFVSSLDGVVAFEPEVGEAAGTLLSSRNPSDRFLMGLLRAVAGAVLIGAGTLRAEPRHLWTPEAVFPDLAAEFAELRRSLRLPARPDLFVVSASGHVDAESAALRAGAIVLSGEVDLAAVIADLHARGHERVLTEGGPRLMGALLQERLVDEVFLTLSPVIAGRVLGERPGFVSGAAFLPASRRAAKLASLRRAGDYLFARYNLNS